MSKTLYENNTSSCISNINIKQWITCQSHLIRTKVFSHSSNIFEATIKLIVSSIHSP